MSSTSVKQRISYYDIAKGIGIITVVYAHARAPFSKYIYLFHMPFFFLISGLLYNSKTTIMNFSKRKFVSLYIPFVFWNALFFIVKSLIAGRGIVPIFKETVKIILTLSKDGQFFGATWFLGALFVISILYKVLEAKLPESKTKDAALLIFFGALAFMSIQITLKYMLSRTFVLSAYFAAGAFVKKHEIDKTLLSKEYGWFAAACFIAFAVMGHYNSSNMGKNEYEYPIVFLIGAFLASYAVLYLSKWLDDFTKTEIREETGKRPLYHSITSILTPIISSVNKLLIFVGKNSIDIVIWHFIAFRIVIVVQMYLNHEAITMLNVLSYYPMYSEAHGWWIIYTIVGLFVPLVWCGILRVGPWGKLFKKMHIV